MSFSGPQDHYITKDTFIEAYSDNVRLGTLAWESFLGSLSNDPNSGYYGTSFDRPSISGTPGYIVNYLFASGLIDGPILDQIIANNGGDPNGYYAGIINSNPVTQRYYTWHTTKQDIVNTCEESGCADPGDQAWYDRWKASGEPTTQDDMWSEQQYDEWLSSPANTLIPGVDDKGNKNSSWEEIRNGLIQEGYDPELVDDLIDGKMGKDGVFHPGVKWDTTTEGAALLENILENVTGKNWDILELPTESAQTYSIDTDGDGVYDTVVIRRGDGGYEQVYGADVDPNDPTIIGQIKDLQRNVDIYEDSVNSEGWDELEDWEKNAVLRENGYDYNRDGWFGDGPDDYTEFGLCSDNYTVKKDSDGSNCDDFLTDEEKLVRDYGQEAVDKAKEIYNGIEDWVEGAIEDPLGAVKGILDTVYSGMPEECKESNTNKPDDWWKDCTNLSVLGQIPGLPIPLPPGTIDVNTTVRDLENAAIEAGKTLEDIFNPTCTGTPAEIEECENRTISDIIGDWASDIWDSIKDAWEDLEDKTEQGLLNILIDAGYSILSGWILTEIKDAVTLDDPLAFFPIENCNNPEWREQATAQQLALCNSAVNCEEQGLTGGYVKDIGECVDPDPDDCEGQNKTLKSDGTCGECLDGSQKDFGQGCVDVCEYDESLPADSPDCKEPWTDGGKTEEQCAAEGRLHVPGDAATETDSSCGDCLPTHVDEEGTCKEWIDPGPTEAECTEQNRVYRPSTGTGRDSSCGGCLDNFELINGECKEEGLEPPCEPPLVRNEETRECEEADPGFKEGDPCTTEDGKAGTYDSEGVCVPDWVNPGPSVQDCEALGKTHISGDPSAQKPSECGGCKNPTWNPIGDGGECVAPVRCWDDSTAATEAECPEEPQIECWDGEIVNDESKCSQEPPKVDCAAQNKVQKTPYECGGCLPNFELNPDSQECEEPEEDPNNCAAQGKTLNEDKSCGECTEEGWTSEGPGEPCKAPQECNAETATKTVNLTETIPFGDPLPDPVTTYEDDGTQCVATTTTYVQEPDPNGTVCGDGKAPEVEGGECVECPEWSQYENASSLAACGEPPQECNEETYTSEVNLTETIPFGNPIPDPVTTYEDDGTQCVATTTTYVEGPDTSVDCTTLNEDNYQECEGTKCDDGTYVKKGETCGSTGGCVDNPQTDPEKEACDWKNCPGEEGLYPPDHECGTTPPGECQDPEANNQGKPLPCTFDPCPDGQPRDENNKCPGGLCNEEGANNVGQPLPCTFDPCPGGADRDADGNCPEDLCPDGSQKDADGNCPGNLCPDGSQKDADGNCPSTGCVDNPQTDAEKEACGYKRCTEDGPLVPKDTDCGNGCVDNPQTFMEKVDCGWTVCPDGITVVEDPNECGPSCTNGALDYPDCLVCPGGELPDAETGCGPTGGTCDDPVYAAENPLECDPGVCKDCSCPEYAAANPEECLPGPPPPPPPPPEGGGGGSGGGNAQLKPLSITGDPELLARQEFPITDYLSGLFTGRG